MALRWCLVSCQITVSDSMHSLTYTNSYPVLMDSGPRLGFRHAYIKASSKHTAWPRFALAHKHGGYATYPGSLTALAFVSWISPCGLGCCACASFCVNHLRELNFLGVTSVRDRRGGIASSFGVVSPSQADAAQTEISTGRSGEGG